MKRHYGQREYMRELVARHGLKKDVVCKAYAKAELQGLVQRKSRVSGRTPEEYALLLWHTGAGENGWLHA